MLEALSSSFGFLYPAALLAGPLAAAFLFYAYRRHGQGRRLPVGTTYLLQILKRTSSARKKFKPPLRFFLELLLFLLLALALSGLFRKGGSERIALLIDNSFSTFAKLPGNAGTVFQHEIEEVGRYLDSLSIGSEIEVWITTPKLKSVTGEYVSPSRAASSLSEIKPQYGGDNLSGALGALTRDRAKHSIVAFTDRAEAVGEKTDVSIRKSSSAPLSNFALYGGVFRSGAFSMQLRSFSDKNETVKISVHAVQNDGTERFIDASEISLNSGATETVSFTSEAFDPQFGMPVHASLQAASDAIEEDNELFAAPGASGNTVYFVGDLSPEKLDLNRIQSLRFVHVLPEAGNKSFDRPVIFHRFVPDALPSANSLFVMAPKGNPFFKVIGEEASPVITRWEAAHPLTTYLNVPVLSLGALNVLREPAWMQEIISIDKGSVLISGEKNGHRYAATGFEIFPFEGRSSPSRSVLTLNLLKWISGEAVGARDIGAGTQVSIDKDVSKVLYRGREALYDREKNKGESISPPHPGLLTFQTVDGSTRLGAVSFYREEESNLLVEPKVVLPPVQNFIGKSEGDRSFVPLIAIGAAAILLLDLLILIVRRRVPGEA